MNKTAEYDKKLQVSKAADYFKALGHPTRMNIAKSLIDKQLSVSEVMNAVNVQQANASQHLKIMKIAGVVNYCRVGTQVIYSLDKKVRDLFKIMGV